ncbi:MAG: hypothetical protein ACOZCO_07645 [Bacteroidota bacterium]
MAKERFSGKFKGKKYTVDVNLTVLTWKDKDIYYVYAPALDLTGYDKSLNAAKDSFTETLNQTLNYMQNKGTIFDELERLGWTVNRKKKRVVAPNHEEILSDNKHYRDLVKKAGVRKSKRDIELTLA